MNTGRQAGISLVGLILLLAVLGFLGVLAMKIVPTYTEYRAVQNAIAGVQQQGGSVAEIRSAFDTAASVNHITAISGKDLLISKENGVTEIRFAYEKKIPLAGPASLLLEYAGSTAPGNAVNK